MQVAGLAMDALRQESEELHLRNEAQALALHRARLTANALIRDGIQRIQDVCGQAQPMAAGAPPPTGAGTDEAAASGDSFSNGSAHANGMLLSVHGHSGCSGDSFSKSIASRPPKYPKSVPASEPERPRPSGGRSRGIEKGHRAEAAATDAEIEHEAAESVLREDEVSELAYVRVPHLHAKWPAAMSAPGLSTPASSSSCAAVGGWVPDEEWDVMSD